MHKLTVMKKYILALDQGTTSSRAIIFDRNQNIIASAQREFKQYYPKPSWVEHDALEIRDTQFTVAREALEKAGLTGSDIEAIGITNQRETTVVWDRYSGKPICPAIVWQCRRTADYCDKLIANGHSETIKDKTGLIIDAYFSATKLKWILDNTPDAREKAKNGDILFGTIDTWLLWNLTGGKIHATDYSNASRTMMFNINTLCWDDELLSLFDIPNNMLPTPRPSSYDFGKTTPNLFGVEIPITGIAGDQQAALFGQTAFNKGDVKNTYGTGCFVLMNTGEKPIRSKSGLVSSIAWGIEDKVIYALEGSVFIGGAVIQWLRDELAIIPSSSASELEARKVNDSGGVYFVPAFTGLGAPYWDQDARGTMIGLTRGTNRSHIVRAALESIAYQSHDVIEAMKDDVGSLTSINVDGGAAANDFLMQFQSDVTNIPLNRPSCVESTALGAAALAGLYTGYYESTDFLCSIRNIEKSFLPSMNNEERQALLDGWHTAVSKTLTD